MIHAYLFRQRFYQRIIEFESKLLVHDIIDRFFEHQVSLRFSLVFIVSDLFDIDAQEEFTSLSVNREKQFYW